MTTKIPQFCPKNKNRIRTIWGSKKCKCNKTSWASTKYTGSHIIKSVSVCVVCINFDSTFYLHFKLSDVEAGGATVFTVGKTAVFPSKVISLKKSLSSSSICTLPENNRIFILDLKPASFFIVKFLFYSDNLLFDS